MVYVLWDFSSINLSWRATIQKLMQSIASKELV